MTTLHDRVCSLLMCVCVSSIYFVFVFICRMTDFNNSVLLPQPFLRLSCHTSPTKAELAHLIILLSLSSLHCYQLPMLLLPASFFAFYVCNTLCLYLRMLVFVFFILNRRLILILTFQRWERDSKQANAIFSSLLRFCSHFFAV